jgi:hypothetical protein
MDRSQPTKARCQLPPRAEPVPFSRRGGAARNASASAPASAAQGPAALTSTPAASWFMSASGV